MRASSGFIFVIVEAYTPICGFWLYQDDMKYPQLELINVFGKAAILWGVIITFFEVVFCSSSPSNINKEKREKKEGLQLYDFKQENSGKNIGHCH